MYQGLAMSHLLAMVKSRLMEDIRQESLWMRMFADTVVMRSMSREQVDENMNRLKSALERRGMKVSSSIHE